MHCMNSVQIAEGPMGVQADQRLTQRHASRLRVAKLISAGSEELCVIKNLSSNGAMVRIYGEHRVEDPVTVEIDGRRSINGTIVWVERSYAGIAFDGAIDASEVLGRALPGDPIAFMPRAPRFKMEASDAVRIAGRDEAIDMFDISQGGAKSGTSISEPSERRCCSTSRALGFARAKSAGMMRMRPGLRSKRR